MTSLVGGSHLSPKRNTTDKYILLDSLVQPAMWTEVEPCVGIICACLPTLRPLFKECITSLSSKYSEYTNSRPSRQPRSKKSRSIHVASSYGVVTDDENDKRYSHYMDQGAPAPASSRARTNTSEEYPLTDISSIDRNDYKETHSRV